MIEVKEEPLGRILTNKFLYFRISEHLYSFHGVADTEAIETDHDRQEDPRMLGNTHCHEHVVINFLGVLTIKL